MPRVRFKTTIDSTDLFFGIFPAAASYAAFVTWASLIVRAIRGEDVEEDWRVFVSTAAAMSAFAFVSGTRVREAAALRGTAVEVRELVREAEQQDRLTRLTKRLVLLAALTLAAAVVTLVVAIVLA
jgi:hypothetical protein